MTGVLLTASVGNVTAITGVVLAIAVGLSAAAGVKK